VLVVEDSPSDVEQIILALRGSGIDVFWKCVATAEGLRTALTNGPWDIVTSAYFMSGFGGLAALDIVRAIDPDLPFFIVSETVGEDAAVAMMRAGGNDYIRKHEIARLAPAIEREVRAAENRRAKRVAEKTANHLAAIVESSDDAILSKSLDGVIASWNSAAERLYGWTATEAIGQNVSLLVPADKVDELKQNLEQLRNGEQVGYLETVRLHRDGRRIDVALTISQVRDRDGRLIGVSKSARDIRDRKRVEKALQVSEGRYRAFFESTTAGLVEVSTEGQILQANTAFCQMLGYSRHEIQGMPVINLLFPEDREDAVSQYAGLSKRGSFESDRRYCRRDGTPLLARVSAVAVPDAAGRPSLVSVVVMDLTAHRAAEESLRTSEERFRAFMNYTPATAFIKDESGRFLYVNPTWRRQFDPEPIEWQGKTDCDFWPPQTAALFRASDIECLARNTIIVSEETARTAAGEELTWMIMKFPLVDGGCRCVGGMAWNITDRKRAEDTLRLQDRAIQATTQGILISDSSAPDNLIVYASPGYERLTGFSAAETLGRNCRFLQGKDTDSATVAQLREAIRAGESCSVELLNYRKDGHPFWNELTISPLRDAVGRLTHYVGVLADVTARRNLQEQLRQVQKLEAIGQLAGGIAHDFNNLLTIINGYSELLLQRLTPNDPSRAMVVEIQKAGERSAGLTRQLLAFSRQQVLTPQVIDLNDVVTNTDKMLRRLIGADVQLTMTLDPELWAVRADSGQIEQVLMNLAVNARDAMPRGGRLTIETRNVKLDETYARTHIDARAGSHTLLSVTDTGSGMSAEVKARIFEPFFTTKDIGKGTGLGLATVHGIVKQSGGHVVAYSEVGVGTTFKVYLPRVDQPFGMKSHSKILVPPRGTETVLIVEDEDGVRALARQVLLSNGYTVLEASNGYDAVRMASSHEGPIHLLITDVVMPGASGQVVAEQIMQQHPEVRVLFVSGYTDDAVIRHGVLHEGVSFLQKPFSPIDLALKVRGVLDAPKENGRC